MTILTKEVALQSLDSNVILGIRGFQPAENVVAVLRHQLLFTNIIEDVAVYTGYKEYPVFTMHATTKRDGLYRLDGGTVEIKQKVTPEWLLLPKGIRIPDTHVSAEITFDPLNSGRFVDMDLDVKGESKDYDPKNLHENILIIRVTQSYQTMENNTVTDSDIKSRLHVYIPDTVMELCHNYRGIK